MTNKTIINKVFNLFNKYGNKGYIGEKVTQLEHATQCAFLAEEFCYNNICPYKEDLIIGSFLHDIGHLLIFDNDNINVNDNNNKLETMGDYGVMNHEEEGYKYLKERGFNNNICEFVKNHIKTKRYLITKHPEYYEKLSGASKKTFEYQGGKMKGNEMREFENDKLFRYHLKIREFDDKAKSTDKELLQKIKDLNPVKYYCDLYQNTLS